MSATDSTDAAGVFERYRRDVYGWAYRLLGRHHDAQDAAQDVFLRWLAQSQRTVPANPRGWLRQVTINRAIDLLRTGRSAVEAERRDAGQTAGSQARAGAAEEAQMQELRREIARAIENVTEAQRSVLIAKVYDGMTFAQIAGEMGLAVPTVKTHYLRALAAVGDALAPRWAPERSRP